LGVVQEAAAAGASKKKIVQKKNVLGVVSEAAAAGVVAQVTCFTSITVQILTLRSAIRSAITLALLVQKYKY
jgi:hypothetical protein